MEHSKKPSIDLARKVLPPALLAAIENIFETFSEGSCLVGGTALAGFYAGHRRSDDIDLFTKDTFAQEATVEAVSALVEIGATISGQRKSRQHFHCLAELTGHRFTIDVVLDAHFHTLPDLQTSIGSLHIATPNGLLAMKIATLVSRCSEKDLYDLAWLFDNYEQPLYSDFVKLGQNIDSGVSEESFLISLSGANLRESSCHFAEEFGVNASSVFAKINDFRVNLIKEYSSYLRTKKEDFELKKVLGKLRPR